MSHVLTPISSLDIAAITVPDPGDPRTAASVNSPMQSLANTELWLLNHNADFSGQISAPITGAAFDLAAGGAWSWLSTLHLWCQSDVSAAAQLAVDIRLPVGYVLNQVHARVKGNGAGIGAHSALPATMPVVTVYELDPLNNNAVLQSATATDSSVNAAAYDAAHSINITGLAWTIAGFKKYHVVVKGEAGANALANRLTLAAIDLNWSPL